MARVPATDACDTMSRRWAAPSLLSLAGSYAGVGAKLVAEADVVFLVAALDADLMLQGREKGRQGEGESNVTR